MGKARSRMVIPKTVMRATSKAFEDDSSYAAEEMS